MFPPTRHYPVEGIKNLHCDEKLSSNCGRLKLETTKFIWQVTILHISYCMESLTLVCTQTFTLLFSSHWTSFYSFSFELTNYESTLTWKPIKHKRKMLQTPTFILVSSLFVKTAFVILKCIHVSKKKNFKILSKKYQLRYVISSKSSGGHISRTIVTIKKKCAEKNFTHKRTFTQKEVKAIYLASIQTYSRHVLAWGWWQISTVYLYLSFVKKFNLWENSQNASKKTLLCNKV